MLFSIVTNQTTQQQCIEFINKVREVRFNKVRDRQVSKFTRLFNRRSCNVNSENNNKNQVQSNSVNNSSSSNNNNLAQGSITSNIGSKWVVNLSSTPLTPAQTCLLSRGPNFALAPTNPPNVEFISVVEAACQRFQNRMCRSLGLKSTS